MFYLVKTPWLLKRIYSSCVWDMPSQGKKMYLSFDDGPHPEATPFVLDELKKQNAKATFFCIGKNVAQYPEVYKRILEEGHRVGNHTHDHLNGWRVSDEEYINNIARAKKYIDSNLFRPPYGRIKRFQVSCLQKAGFKIIMWDVLSADFDKKISARQCAKNVLKNAKKNSIIVFHDSEKAFHRMKVALTQTLFFFKENGFE
ncbi:MAG: polysaccharide deacetylase family protein, partial [Bacteroidetes bacterium]|nr:polysaccharide deacetylase family protein [Bacteroidota bacterium]